MNRKTYRRQKAALKAEIQDLRCKLANEMSLHAPLAAPALNGALCSNCGTALHPEAMVCAACQQVVEAHRPRLQSLDEAITEKLRAHHRWVQELRRSA